MTALLSDAWLRGDLARIDVPPVPPSELLDLVLASEPQLVLDDLQLGTLISMSDGYPMVALDLAAEACAEPSRVPPRYPRPEVDVNTFGRLAQLRLAARLDSLDPCLRSATAGLAAVSPLPLTTASRIFGTRAVTELISLRIAHQQYEGRNAVVWVSPLQAASAQSRFVDSTHDDLTLPGLAALSHAGYNIGESAGFQLAHHLQLTAQELDEVETGLLVDSSAVACRLGDEEEARALLRTAHRLGRMTAEAQAKADLVGLQLAMLRRDFDDAAEHAEHLVRHVPNPDVGMLYWCAVAVAWHPQTPLWWTNFVDTVTEPGRVDAITVFRSYMGTLPEGHDSVQETLRIGMDDRADPGVRLLALAFLCPALLHAGEPDLLERVISTGIQLGATDGPGRKGHRSEFSVDAYQLFILAAATVGSLAGLQGSALAPAVSAILVEATGLNTRVGWQSTLTSAWLAALIRFRHAEFDVAGLDFAISSRVLKPTFFPLMWLTSISFQTSIQRAAGQHMRTDGALVQRATSCVTEYVAGLLGTVLRSCEDTNPDEAMTASPGWVPRIILHGDVMAGRVSAAHALDVIARAEPLDSPAARARVLHLQGLKTMDPQQLMRAGRELASLGYFAAAKHAFEHARAWFLSARSASKASEANRELDKLATLTVTGFYSNPARVSEEYPLDAPQSSGGGTQTKTGSSVSLTPRELEVCQLVAQGLTNAQIAARLVLSARTVESHVLQARGKLNAAKRRDIPQALLDHGLA
jgi:DNA-binding NarL/FixJ family response regulator